MSKMLQSSSLFLLLLLYHTICLASAENLEKTAEMVDNNIQDGVIYHTRPSDTLSHPSSQPPPQQIALDSELANSFLDMQKGMQNPNDAPSPSMEEINMPNLKSNQIFTAFGNESGKAVPRRKKHNRKLDPYFDPLSPDLVGEDVVLKSRQVGKSRVQAGFNGSKDGFKDQGDFLPWVMITGSTDLDHSSTSTDSSTEFGTVEPVYKPPIDSVHVLPLRPITPNDLFGKCKQGGGADKGTVCFGHPSGCIEEKHCRMAASLTVSADDPSSIIVTMAATAPRGFIALGFSKDRFMGADTVVSCNNIKKTKWMTLHFSLNGDYSNKVQINEDNFVRDFNPIKGYAQDNGVVSCQFGMKTKLHPDQLARNKVPRDGTLTMNSNYDEDVLESTKFLFLAFGRHSEVMDPNSTAFGQLKFHHMTAISSEDESELLKKMIEKGKLLPPRDSHLVMLHIIPYTLAFSFFVPCAIFIGKYGREAYSNEEKGFFGLPHWLAIHATFQNIAVLLTIIGLIGIVNELGGVWRTTYHPLPIVHCVAGLAATVILWINFLLGWTGYFCKSKDHSVTKLNNKDDAKTKRTSADSAGSAVSNANDYDIDIVDTTTNTTPSRFSYNYFKWVHWGIGNLVFWFGMTALVFAYKMKRAQMPCIFMLVVILQILVHVFTHIVMMFHTSYLVMFLDGMHWRRRVYPGPMLAWRKEQIDKKHFPNDDSKFSDLAIWCGRRRAIIFYFITAVLCCIGLLGLMAVPLVICRKPLIITTPDK